MKSTKDIMRDKLVLEILCCSEIASCTSWSSLEVKNLQKLLVVKLCTIQKMKTIKKWQLAHGHGPSPSYVFPYHPNILWVHWSTELSKWIKQLQEYTPKTQQILQTCQHQTLNQDEPTGRTYKFTTQHVSGIPFQTNVSGQQHLLQAMWICMK
jgi:hypothetical protein